MSGSEITCVFNQTFLFCAVSAESVKMDSVMGTKIIVLLLLAIIKVSEMTAAWSVGGWRQSYGRGKPMKLSGVKIGLIN